MSQKGFANIVLVVIIVAIVAVGGYFALNNRSTIPTPTPPVGEQPTPSPSPIPTPVVTPNPTVNPPNNKIGVVGMLNVVTNCMIPEGCGPKYSLSDSEFKSATPLISNDIIKDSDSELIVRVSGSEVPYKCTDMLCSYNSPTKAIKVSTYSTLSKIPYHDFLAKKAFEYTVQKYPCLAVKEYGGTTYNKTFSWEFTNNIPTIKVRMTDTLSGVKPQAFYELWYNGNSGSFIKEIDYPEGKVFCQ